MNKLTQALIVTVLRSLVESVREQPRRVLFKGMADYFTIFQEYVTEQKLSWEIKATQQGAEIVRSRNDPAVETLVVFYQEEVKERESLNAFCQFNEDAVAEGLLALVLDKGVASETYTKEETEKLDLLLGPAKPSPERLAAFLLAGKANVGEALPLLGLFRDPELNYGVRQNTWQTHVSNDNYQTAVLRWRDFLDKAQRPKYALQLSGSRPSLLKEAATNPGLKGQVLKMVTLAEALTILNPPSRQVEKLMNVGLGRLEAQNLLDQVKAGKIDPLIPSAEFPELPEEAIKILKPLYKPRVEKDDSEGLPEVDGKPRRVGCCLEGLLQLTLEEGPLPPHLILERIEPPCPDQKVELRLEKEGWRPTLDGEAIRSLSTAPKASELIFKVSSPLKKSASLIHFSLANLAGHLEGFQECWPEESFWKQAVELYPESRDRWDNLREHVNEIRTIVTPTGEFPRKRKYPLKKP